MMVNEKNAGIVREFALHNGYCEYDYGRPQNPVVFSSIEYSEICQILLQKFHYDLMAQIEKSIMHDVVFPQEIEQWIKYRIAGCYRHEVLSSDTESLMNKEKHDTIIRLIHEYASDR